MDTYQIDAQSKSLGRVASEAAYALRGKNNPAFEPHRAGGVMVIVKNTDKMRLPLKKQKTKTYIRFSGHPSGLKTETMAQVIAKKGKAELLRRAVYGMLPANRLRSNIMKQLIIEA